MGVKAPCDICGGRRQCSFVGQPHPTDLARIDRISDAAVYCQDCIVNILGEWCGVPPDLFQNRDHARLAILETCEDQLATKFDPPIYVERPLFGGYSHTECAEHFHTKLEAIMDIVQIIRHQPEQQTVAEKR